MVRTLVFNGPLPEHGHGNIDTTISGIDPAGTAARVQRQEPGKESQAGRTRHQPPPGASGFEPEIHGITTENFRAPSRRITSWWSGEPAWWRHLLEQACESDATEQCAVAKYNTLDHVDEEEVVHAACL